MKQLSVPSLSMLSLIGACATAPSSAPMADTPAVRQDIEALPVQALSAGDLVPPVSAAPASAEHARTAPPSATGAAQRAPRIIAPITALTIANAEARRRPDPDAFVDARQVYDYAPGALYEVYAAPSYLSTLLLEPGESIVTVAAGDTARWMIEETGSGDLAEPRALLLIKPLRAGIRTNIVLATDRRTYLIEAIAVQGNAYSAQTAWRYAEAHAQSNSAESTHGIAIDHLNFRYRIETVRGRAPPWRPVRVFDDGRRTYIEFVLDLAANDAPPLFLRDGPDVALVNYRVVGNRYVVDRLFDEAELRFGARTQTIVRITRERPRSMGARR